MPTLRSPAVYIPDLKFGRPISLGKVFILNAGVAVPSDASLVNSSDLADVFYNDDSGNQIQVSQPLYTNKGGVIYSGCSDEVRQFYTSATSYEFAVYSSSGAKQYSDTMSDTFGGGGGGSSGSSTIINDWNLAVTPGFYQDASPLSLNQPVIGRRFIGWAANTNESGDSIVQVAIDVTQTDGPAYVRVKSLGSFGAWRQQWDSASFTRQASTLDSTAGAALLVGAGGLVGNAAEWSVTVDDIELTAFYKLSGASSGVPLGKTTTDSTIVHVNIDSVTAYQLFIEASTGDIWSRTKSGTWQDWRKANATGLIPKSASYELINADFGSTVRFSGGATANLTIIDGIGYDGGLIQVINRNSGNVTITGVGVTLTWLQGGTTATGARTLLPGSACTLIRVSSTEYEISGLGLA